MLLIYYLYVWLVDDIVIMLFFKEEEEEYEGFQIVIEVIRREIEIMKFK